MRTKKLIVIALIIMILSYLFPGLSAFATTTEKTVTLNNKLFIAVWQSMMENGYYGFSYNSLLRTISGPQESFDSVEKLVLKESGIKDISGLENFSNLKSLNLSGNYLEDTKELEDVINSFDDLTFLDLSTNYIKTFSWVSIDGLKDGETNYQNQKIKEVYLITPTEEQLDEDTYKASVDDLLLSDASLYSYDLKRTKTDGQKWSWTWSGGKAKEKRIAEGVEEVYEDTIDYDTDNIYLHDLNNVKLNNKMYHVNAFVSESENPYFQSTVDLFYIIVNEDERGVIFKDENFYKAVKKQLSKGQQVNNDVKTKTDSENAYEQAFDTALTMVISIDDLRNTIVSLICQNEKIYDLTGLEQFIGLKTEFNASYNYIDTIEKVIELEDNKAEEERKIREEVKATINRFTSDKNVITDETVNYLEEIKKYVDAKKAYEEAYKAWNDESDPEKKKSLKDKMDKAEETANNLKGAAEQSMASMERLMADLESVWAESGKVSTIQTAELYEMDTTDLFNMLNEDNAKKLVWAVFKPELDNLVKMEQAGFFDRKPKNETQTVSDYIATLIVSTLGLDSDATTGDKKPIENLIHYNGGNDIANASADKLVTILNVIKNYDVKINPESTAIALTDVFFDDVKKAFEDSNYEKLYYLAQNLVANNNDGILSAVIKLPRLRKLDMSINNIEELTDLDKLTELSELWLQDNLITDVNSIGWENLSKLAYLNLSKNPIVDISELKNATSLQGLWVQYCLLSGEFDFDFLEYYKKLEEISFEGNGYTDLTKWLNKYIGGFKNSDKPTFVSYIRKKYEGVNFDFRYQKIKLPQTTVSVADGDTVTFELPPIFRNIEEMDPYNTTFGIVPMDGSVEEKGTTATFNSSVSGTNNGKVDIRTPDKRVNNVEDRFSVGHGTVCTISYINTSNNSPVQGGTNPGTNPTPTPQPKPKPGVADDSITIDDDEIKVDEDGYFIITSKAGVSIKNLVKKLQGMGWRVSMVDGETDLQSPNMIYTGLSVSMANTNLSPDDQYRYEVAVLGDIDGNGKVDSIDSGYARALRYGSLFASVEDESERNRLLEEYKETVNYRAADIINDGEITKEDVLCILYTRAGLDVLSKYIQ